MAQSTLATRVMYDGLYTFVMRLLNVACAAGVGILAARLLGPGGKGTYALPGVEAGLVTAGLSGVGTALSFFLLNRRPGRAILRPVAYSSAVFIAAGAVVVVALAFFAGQRWAALPAILTLPSAAAINIASGYAIGIKRVRYATGISVALTVVTFILLGVALTVIAKTPRVAINAWVVANGILGVCSLGAVFFHARRQPVGDGVSVREFFKFSVKTGAVNLVSLLNYRADLYIVALLLNPAALGFYTVAVSAAESLLMPTQIASLVTAPHIGALDRDGAAALAARCVRNNLLIALAVCGLLIAVTEPLIRLLYGAAFTPVVPVLRVLLIGVVALSLSGPLASFFTLKLGRPGTSFWLAGSSAVICIAISLFLVPRIGLMGAALGSTAGYLCGQAAAFWVFKRDSGIGLRTVLTPTASDFKVYAGFLSQMLTDGRALWRGSTR